MPVKGGIDFFVPHMILQRPSGGPSEGGHREAVLGGPHHDDHTITTSLAVTFAGVRTHRQQHYQPDSQYGIANVRLLKRYFTNSEQKVL